uniref:Translation initiation factor 1 n=1 Tax=Gentianopsis paludosa TaxID=50802 RepID=A0A7G7WT60_9GENT|nr:translation initiation factor 1 [Gentianopsis paludosa]QNH70236.1 translation initiation factor 1 [Gentianopsis paludosa]UEP17477.1 translational initiation factor 1 [Gentianopsis barbata]
MKEQKWIQEGLITESLPNGMFRIRLDTDDLILGYVQERSGVVLYEYYQEIE